MLERHFRDISRICEQPEIEGCELREVQVVPRQRVDVAAAPPVRSDTRAQTIVEPATLCLEVVPRRAPGRAGGIAVEIIELEAGRDLNLVGECDRVGQRKLNPPAVT